jgi:hypothetical protein
MVNLLGQTSEEEAREAREICSYIDTMLKKMELQGQEVKPEPKKPKTELIQESEIPIAGVTIISFEEYRKLGGQMGRTQYEQIKRVRTTQDLCRQALRESHEVGGAYVDASQMELLARIIAVVPNMSSFDRVCEMFLLQGKK